MKKRITGALCFLAVLPVFAQKETVGSELLDHAMIRVYYHFTQKEKAIDEAAFRNDTMTLDIGARMACYYDETKTRKDSIVLSALNSLKPDAIQSINVLKGDYAEAADRIAGEKHEQNYYDGTTEKIYKNRTNGEITITDEIKDNYRCEDPVGSLNWEITSDTTVVLDYACQKAKIRFRGREYEAWFTPEIPVSEGPWKFFGLPGLILMVKDNQGLIAFECIGLQQLEQPEAIVISQGKYIRCSRKELEKVQRNRGASQTYYINGGNLTFIKKDLASSFQFLELE
ncbi:hypothetical protein FACS1894182_04530 [Bacteroidia bacterium]|nr:hypothetical protein FACS1894182_04530 [Bacteroidia bacterium]